jgi:uncharacterized phiE125 gp8 family phage protein
VRYSVTVKSAPPAEPVTRAEAKLHLKVDATADDALIDGLIVASREWTENYCRRSWVQRTLELRLDCFPGEIRLPRSPVSQINSITWLGQDGSSQTLASSAYQVDYYGTPPRILPPFGSVFPIPKLGTLNAVVVEYVAGYTPGSDSPTDYAANVPSSIKAAMKLVMGCLYENRSPEDAPEFGVIQRLLAPYEIRDLTLES